MSSDNSQPNTRINEVREEGSKYLEELRLNIRCDEDESHTAVLYCLKCEVDLCEICSDGIHSRKSLSTHKIVRLTQKPDPVIYCPLHPRSTAELVCKETNCKSLNNPMCTICYQYETHKGHKHERLDQEYAKIRINIENCLKEIEKKRTICQKYINEHDRCISTYCDAETGFLRLEKNKIRKLANDFETSALKLLNEFVNDQVKIGEDSKKKYESEITKLDNMRSELQNMEEMKKLEVIKNCENVERLMRQSAGNITEPNLVPSSSYTVTYPMIEPISIKRAESSSEPQLAEIDFGFLVSALFTTKRETPVGDLLEFDPPDNVVFHGPFTSNVKTNLTLRNPTIDKVAFKVKIKSTMDNYSARPNGGMLNPGETVIVVLTMNPNFGTLLNTHNHKFQIESCIVPPNHDPEHECVWKIVNPADWRSSKLKVYLAEWTGIITPGRDGFHQSDILDEKPHLI